MTSSTYLAMVAVIGVIVECGIVVITAEGIIAASLVVITVVGII